MQCHRKNSGSHVDDVCDAAACMRWVDGIGDEPGNCMDNIQTQFTVRLLNVIIKSIVPLAQAMAKVEKKDD